MSDPFTPAVETPVISPESAVAPKASRKEWVGLAVLALPCILYSMDLTVLNLAVPQMARDLRPSASQLLWIIDIYGFMVAGFLMVMGSLGDRLGRRRILLIGAAAFGVASILAAFAQTTGQLIVARAVLGIAGATLAPSTLSLITSMFRDHDERTFAISIWIMSFSVGAIIGPVAGGVLIQFFWWGSVFLVAVPVMVLLLVLGPLLLPEHRDDTYGRIDYLSALLSLVAVLGLIYGVKLWAEHGLGLGAAGSIGAGLAVATIFLRRQTVLANSLVDLRLFASKVFSLSLAINALALFFMFGTFILMAQYFQLVVGLTPLEAGLWTLPGAAAFAIAAPFTSRLTAWLSPVRVMAGGLAVAAVGFVMVAASWNLLGVVVAAVVMSVGFTPVVTLTTGFIVGAAPVGKAGVASAISETGAELGGALGIAILGSLLTAIYRTAMLATDLPEMPARLARAAEATLAGAVEAATQLSPAAADALLTVARGAFVDAFKLSAAIGAVSLAALAMLTVRVLKGARPAEGHG